MLRTAECVSPKHPDKLCDRISDAILDECLKQDPDSRVAVETMGGHGIITITGEVTTKAYFNAREIAQRIAGEQYGVQTNIVRQSPEIANGVDTGGAGDQGIMVGYACDENEEMIPQELYLARSLCKFIYAKCSSDGKTQITIEKRNTEDSLGNDYHITSIVCSWCGVSAANLNGLISFWKEEMQVPCMKGMRTHVNPAGDWNIGGFEADTGVTGRKLAVDNYGPRIPIGGGAFSGKDGTKVDRSGAYQARQIAVKELKATGAKEVYVYLAYSIGVADPVMMTIKTDGHERTVDQIHEMRSTPDEMIQSLGLKYPVFEKTAEWGAFGDETFIWNN